MTLDDLDLNLKLQAIADPKELSLLDKANLKLEAILEAVGEFHVEIPRMFQVFGKVSVDKIDSLPPVHINNLSELHNAFIVLANQISALQKTTIQAMQAIKLTVPKDMTVNNEVKINKFAELLEGIEELKKGFNILINKEAATIGFPSTSIPVEIQNWKVAQPVTNVSINPNRGTVLATAVSVTASATPLPVTALADRRSMTIFNNSSVTVYVGGSSVTTANGMPVPAGAYGPSIDAGPRNIVYAIVATGTADVRVLEMNDITTGGDS
jgi:hypothetical protein